MGMRPSRSVRHTRTHSITRRPDRGSAHSLAHGIVSELVERGCDPAAVRRSLPNPWCADEMVERVLQYVCATLYPALLQTGDEILTWSGAGRLFHTCGTQRRAHSGHG